MKRSDVINWFIQKYGYTRYLEIGIDNPSANYDLIKIGHRVGVDPNKNTTYRLTSDKFFEINEEQFDIGFVDGLHLRDQVIRDVENLLKCLSPNGTILMHDCHPYNHWVGGAEHQEGKSWYGTVWQAFAHLRATRPDLAMRTADCDCGIGIVRRGSQELYKGKYETWEDYEQNQDEILQLISPYDLDKYYA